MKRLLSAFFYSLSGLKLAWRQEAAFRQEVVLAFVLAPVAPYLANSGAELALLWLTLCIVLVAELLNTAIEAAVDRAGQELHPLAKTAKDAGSAAVLVALFGAAAVWVTIAIYQ